MKEAPYRDYSYLERAYLELRRTLYKKLFLYIMITNAIVMTIELLRAVFSGQFGSLFTFVVMLTFTVILARIILNIKDKQEIAITVFIALFYFSGLMANYHGKGGYFDNPLDSFYFAYALAIFERIVMTRIPTPSYRTIYNICTTIIRILVIPSNDKGMFTIQFVYVMFGIYLDLDKERHDQNLFKSYFNSKNQLEKFKNLVVNDIPDSIAIVSQDLSQCLFANRSFSTLSDADINSDIRAYLNQYEIQEEQNKSQSLTSISTIPPKKTLLSFLQSTLHNPEFSSDKKFSCNLTYSKNTSGLQAENNNSSCIFEAKVFSIVWDEVPSVAIILHDITQQHTILSLKIADAHKDTLLATVSHELRTPLNGMLGMIQILHKRTSDTESMKYLNICKNSGNLLMGLVNSILDLNQIRAKKLKLNPDRVNLFELLNDIVRLFELQCSQKSIFLKLNISASAPKFIITDPNRLTQIFINLIGNALKFTRRGGITISAKDSSDGRYIRFIVEDTGIGIKEEDKGKLFKMFGKLEQSDSRTNRQGVGLGLTISDNLARLLCGENDDKAGIKLDSLYGKGTVFSFSIRTMLTVDGTNNSIEGDFISTEEDTDVERKIKEYEILKKEPTFERLKNLSDDNRHLLYKNNIQMRRNSRGINMPAKMTNFKSEGHINLMRPLVKSDTCVLIVDDNPFNIVVAEYLITSHGYIAKTALYGQTAIDIISNTDFAKEPIKLILMDCQMPVMDGYETTKILTSLMQQRKIPKIPIVALTANNSDVDKEASRRSGMCDFITKPLKEADLFKILDKYVDS